MAGSAISAAIHMDEEAGEVTTVYLPEPLKVGIRRPGTVLHTGLTSDSESDEDHTLERWRDFRLVL